MPGLRPGPANWRAGDAGVMVSDSIGDFTAIDLETANPDAFSICQIGVARYRDGELVGEWMSYIDPEVRFNRDNIAIHGITGAAVRGWPTLGEVVGELRGLLDGRIVVSHSGFDRVALDLAFDRQGIRRLDCVWLDSAKVAQRAWAGFARGGYGLENLCRILGYRYQRHDALGDAKAAGVVVSAAMEQTGVGLGGWLRLAERPVEEGPRVAIRPLAAAAGVGRGPLRRGVRAANRVLGPEALRLLARGDGGG